jgi:DnaK suppressor protein
MEERMDMSAQMIDPKRRDAVHGILTRLRDETYEEIARFRQDQGQFRETSPGDEMDQARASMAIDTQANLIDRAEHRLRLIDEALARVENGTYGICADCGEQIGIERLKVLPFALRCIDDENRHNKDATRRGRPDEGIGRQWVPPADMNYNNDTETEVMRDRGSADDLAVVPADDVFGAGEEGGGPEKPRRGRRPRNR